MIRPDKRFVPSAPLVSMADCRRDRLLALAVLAVLVDTVPFLRPRAVVTGVGAAVTVECADPSPVVDRAALGLTPGGRR